MSRFYNQLIVASGVACMTLATTLMTAQAQNLTLTIDPYSGVTTIQNTSASPLTLDGYQVTSTAGALVPGNWTSLTDQHLTGWQKIAPTTTSALSELNLSSYSTVPANGSLNLGHLFTPNGTQDLSWAYSAPTGSGTEASVIPAPLLYAGGLQVQVITLVNPNGSVIGTQALLLNQETTPSFNVDAYIIQSASGSLNPTGFKGYAGHNVAGWQSAAPSANALSELNLSSSSTLAPGHDQVLGAAFTAGSANDLSLQFHLVGPSTTALNGTVVYKTVLNADANADGIVNGQDIALVASNWLHTGTPSGDVNYDGIVNGQDIALIASNWLNVLSGGGGGSAVAVPEPNSVILLAIGVSGACLSAVRRKRRAK